MGIWGNGDHSGWGAQERVLKAAKLGLRCQLSSVVTYRPEDLSLIPKVHVKKPSVVEYACNPITGEAGTGR